MQMVNKKQESSSETCQFLGVFHAFSFWWLKQSCKIAIKYLPSWHCPIAKETFYQISAAQQLRPLKIHFRSEVGSTQSNYPILLWRLLHNCNKVQGIFTIKASFYFIPGSFISVLTLKTWRYGGMCFRSGWFPQRVMGSVPSYSRECELQHDEWNTRCVTNHPLLLRWTLSSFQLLGPALASPVVFYSD